MVTRSSALRSLLGSAVLLILLAGCGGAAATDDDPPEGTLAEFFGYDEENAERLEEDFAEQDRHAQELIVACMAREGFEYIPVDYSDGAFYDQAFEARENLSPEEYAQQYGYGISTQEQEVAEEDEFVDPNQEYIEAMGQAEQEAYYRALYGEQEEIDPEAEGEVDYGFGGGCQGEASEEIYGGDAAVNEELGPKYEELYERIESDPRIVEANEAWSSCMAEAGYDFAHQYEAPEHISNRMNELWGAQYSDAPPPEELEGEEFVPPEIDEAALAELREEEIAVAVADQRCSQEHLSEDLREEVSAEYESAFIAENRELLEQARDAMNGG